MISLVQPQLFFVDYLTLYRDGQLAKQYARIVL